MSQFAFCTSLTLSHGAFIRRSPTTSISSCNNLVSTTRIPILRRRARTFPHHIKPYQPNCNNQEHEFQLQLSSHSDQTTPSDTKKSESNTNANSSPDPQQTPPDSIWTNLTSFRNIRKLLIPISLFGFAETSYLTFNKIFSSPGAICSTEGCLDVLTGPFSSFMGIPLTLFGQLSYALFAYLAIWPLTASDEERPVDPANPEADPVVVSASEQYAVRDAATRPLMLALSTIMVSFSAYLMSLLVFVIKSMCPYCVASAVCSVTLFTLTAFVGRAVPKWKPAVGISAASTVAATAAAGLLYFVSMPAQLLAQPPSEPQAPPEITMKSNSDSLVRKHNFGFEFS